jgi:HNH endonuclease
MGRLARIINTEARFWTYVQINWLPGKCWLWKGPVTKTGYGVFRLEGGRGKVTRIVASRFALLLQVGQLPKHMFACHTCDNPQCVRPDHLFPGTAKDNTKDSMKKGRHKSNIHHTKNGRFSRV